ncbi:alpha/beta hydrolase [bacterium]|nr:MAG: alpha/beta hydrolase [bacterium]MCL4229954.1 alpha/beta hydrolase [Dehalococcoidia bacterium]
MISVNVRGVAFECVDEGHGDPPFVFIHGWCCDHTFWQPQIDGLKGDHRCLAINLRGRGGSSAVPPYDTTTAADDVAAIMEARGIGPAIIAGHSLGGLVALLLNDRRPELVRGIVLGDSPLTAAGGGGLQGASEAVAAAGSMEPMRNMIETFFVEDTPHDIRTHALNTMLSCPAEVAAGMVSNGEVFVQRLEELIKEADKKPLMAIWGATPLGDPERLREMTMFVRQEPVAGAGHFFELEQPQVTNALLRAFVDDVLRDPRSALSGTPAAGDR